MTSLIPFTPGRGPERLVVGGWYDTAGGLPNTASLAMWDGSSWASMGTGWTGTTRGSIWSAAVWNGRLYVGGGVVNTQPAPAPPGTGWPIGGVPWQGMASWDGQSWASHVSSMTGFSPYIGSLLVFNDGSGEALYAAGRFTGINGVAGTAQIARFNGTTWSSVGGGLTSTTVTAGLEAMTIFDDGRAPALYVAGTAVFGTGLPTCNVAKWNGTSWTALGGQIGTGRLTCISSFDDGSGPKLYIGGTAMPQISYIARWEGGAWTPVGGGVTGGAIPPSNFPSVFGMGRWQNKLYIAGNFVQLNNTTAANGVAAWTACTASCYANCDSSTGTPILTANDFQCFLDRVAAGESYANCDGSTGTPTLTANDFQCFLDLYAAGCS
jgi:hypothetical protein